MAAEPAPAYVVDVQIDDEYADQVDAEALVEAVIATLRYQARSAGEVTVVVTNDEAVRQFNRDYLGIDATTDVLSFPAQETPDPAAPALAVPSELAEELAAYLGDIIIAYPYAAHQAEHYGVSVTSELRLLVVHGTLHLLGYDHDGPAAEAAMWAAQEAVLAEFGDQELSQRRYDT